MKSKYIFEGSWNLLSITKPVNAQRVLLTNGDSIVIGSLTDDIHWIYDRGDMKDYNPIAWMELPSTLTIKISDPHENIL